MVEFAQRSSRQRDGLQDKLAGSVASDPAPLTKERQRPAVPEGALQRIRSTVGAPFVRLLGLLDRQQKREEQALEARLEQDYLIWANFYERMLAEFTELWDFFGFIEHDTKNWFRSSRIVGAKSFLGITREGYSFSAGLEQNHVPGSPFPSKWLLVSLAHSDHSQAGIGDERCLGRRSPISEKLTGLKDCDPRILGKGRPAAEELRRRAESTALLFQMFSEAVGQKAMEVAPAVLANTSLVDLCKGLFVALNSDVLPDFFDQLPIPAKLLTQNRQRAR